MIGGISRIGSYVSASNLRMRVNPSEGVRPAARASAVMAAANTASPGTPVEPVRPVPVVEADAPRGISYLLPFLREGADPARVAVQKQILYMDPANPREPAAAQGVTAGAGVGTDTAQGAVAGLGVGADEVQKTARKAECQTCKKRRYQDGSDDAGVSFKTPTRIAPEQAAAAVRGHEQQHVVRERAAAAREDRRVVSQTVTIHTAICPECGKAYIAGGTTRTTTVAEPQSDGQETDPQQSGK